MSLVQIGKLLRDRILTAATTPVSLSGWLKAAGWLGLYGAIALPFGWFTQFFQWQPLSEWQQILRLAGVALILPALTEELLFRVCWWPCPSKALTLNHRWLWGLAGVGLFVLYHPLNALIFLPSHRQTFLDPRFLMLAALLGTASTGAYLQTRSLWPPVLLHWLVVVIWLVGLGGYEQLHSVAL